MRKQKGFSTWVRIKFIILFGFDYWVGWIESSLKAEIDDPLGCCNLSALKIRETECLSAMIQPHFDPFIPKISLEILMPTRLTRTRHIFSWMMMCCQTCFLWFVNMQCVRTAMGMTSLAIYAAKCFSHYMVLRQGWEGQKCNKKLMVPKSHVSAQ